jgi:hypothetical protein
MPAWHRSPGIPAAGPATTTGPQRYNRRQRHIFYLAVQTAMMRPGPSRDYYLRKRSERLLHTQALLALARRRVHVLSAMLRGKRLFTSTPPVTQAA